MPTILACTDGSVYSNSVYDHSAWAARRLQARVRVLHMLDPRRDRPLNADLSGAIGVDAQKKLTEELVALEEAKGRVAQTKAQAILTSARARLNENGITEVATEARHGTLAESIEALEAGADLVVIGKRGESADFAKLHLGANLERVIRSCHHPVLVTSRAFKPMERMLIAYDGGPSARKAVEYAASQPLLRGLQCHLLTVGPPNAALDSGLAQARETLVGAGYTVQADHLPGHAEEVIAQTVKREQTDLLVMGAYGHSRIRQFIVGSTTTTMVRTCLIPVLMFR
jgi:nucleotide-binding universal stress UspA family protein